MSGYYSSNDATSNEARAVVHQLSVDDLKKLMSSDDEVTKLVRNLTEVGSHRLRTSSPIDALDDCSGAKDRGGEADTQGVYQAVGSTESRQRTFADA